MIDTICIVHHTHVDIGYTDHQQTAMTKLVQYVDEALDAIERSRYFEENARFRWTQEVFLPLKIWWECANRKKRKRLLDAIAEGSFEVGALPVNVTCFSDAREWEYMMNLLPASIADVSRPETVMINDTNGISHRGMELAWDRGIRMLWMGPNSYYGTPPSPAPFPFYWELAPGKRILVWCNSSYNDGTFFFNKNWRQGPVPAAYDLRYRKPGKGDLFRTDKESLKYSHSLLEEKIRQLTGETGSLAGTDGFTKCKTRNDYPFRTLVTSVAGQWRCDNDPPFAELADFVQAWNEEGYIPKLKICTVSQAIRAFAEEAHDIPLYRGAWTDYWANGLATSPAEMAHAREARRILSAACSPALGKMRSNQKKQEKEILYNLMMVGEHTFASWDSASDPNSPNTRGQIAEKEVYFYRALEGARMLLEERMRNRFVPEFGTVMIFNSAPFEKSISLKIPSNCLRGEYSSLEDRKTGEEFALTYGPGVNNFLRPESEAEFSEDNVGRTFGDVCVGASASFGPICIGAGEVRVLHLSVASVEKKKEYPLPLVHLDENGWPIWIGFSDISCPLVDGNYGIFRSVRARGVSPRWTFKDVFDTDEQEERIELARKLLIEQDAQYLPAECMRDEMYLQYTQKFTHPSIRLGRRTITVDLISRRVKISVKIDRLPDYTPEIFYLGFRAPVGERCPETSLSGGKFRILEEQIPGSCRDFVCIDGWLGYGENIKWNWFARDTSLVCIGRPRPSTRMEALPSDTREFWAQVFDNSWDTNFNPNAWGRLVFRFDVEVGDIPEPVTYFEAMATEPVILVHTKDQ